MTQIPIFIIFRKFRLQFLRSLSFLIQLKIFYQILVFQERPKNFHQSE